MSCYYRGTGGCSQVYSPYCNAFKNDCQFCGPCSVGASCANWNGQVLFGNSCCAKRLRLATETTLLKRKSFSKRIAEEEVKDQLNQNKKKNKKRKNPQDLEIMFKALENYCEPGKCKNECGKCEMAKNKSATSLKECNSKASCVSPGEMTKMKKPDGKKYTSALEIRANSRERSKSGRYENQIMTKAVENKEGTKAMSQQLKGKLLNTEATEANTEERKQFNELEICNILTDLLVNKFKAIDYTKKMLSSNKKDEPIPSLCCSKCICDVCSCLGSANFTTEVESRIGTATGALISDNISKEKNAAQKANDSKKIKAPKETLPKGMSPMAAINTRRGKERSEQRLSTDASTTMTDSKDDEMALNCCTPIDNLLNQLHEIQSKCCQVSSKGYYSEIDEDLSERSLKKNKKGKGRKKLLTKETKQGGGSLGSKRSLTENKVGRKGKDARQNKNPSSAESSSGSRLKESCNLKTCTSKECPAKKLSKSMIEVLTYASNLHVGRSNRSLRAELSTGASKESAGEDLHQRKSNGASQEPPTVAQDLSQIKSSRALQTPSVIESAQVGYFSRSPSRGSTSSSLIAERYARPKTNTKPPETISSADIRAPPPSNSSAKIHSTTTDKKQSAVTSPNDRKSTTPSPVDIKPEIKTNRALQSASVIESAQIVYDSRSPSRGSTSSSMIAERYARPKTNTRPPETISSVKTPDNNPSLSSPDIRAPPPINSSAKIHSTTTDKKQSVTSPNNRKSTTSSPVDRKSSTPEDKKQTADKKLSIRYPDKKQPLVEKPSIIKSPDKRSSPSDKRQHITSPDDEACNINTCTSKDCRAKKSLRLKSISQEETPKDLPIRQYTRSSQTEPIEELLHTDLVKSNASVSSPKPQKEENAISSNKTSVKSSDKITAIGSPDKKPSVRSPDKITAAGTPDKKPSVRSPDKITAVGTPDKKPSVRSPDKITAVGSPDKKPSVRSPDKITAVGTPDKKPSVRSPDKITSVGSPDKKPSVRPPDKKTSLRSFDKKPLVKCPDNIAYVRCSDTIPFVRSPVKITSLRSPDKKPFIRSTYRTPSIRPSDIKPPVRSPDTKPPIRSSDKTPSVKPPDKKPTMGSFVKKQNITSPANNRQPIKSPDNKQPITAAVNRQALSPAQSPVNTSASSSTKMSSADRKATVRSPDKKTGATSSPVNKASVGASNNNNKQAKSSSDIKKPMTSSESSDSIRFPHRLPSSPRLMEHFCACGNTYSKQNDIITKCNCACRLKTLVEDSSQTEKPNELPLSDSRSRGSSSSSATRMEDFPLTKLQPKADGNEYSANAASKPSKTNGNIRTENTRKTSCSGNKRCECGINQTAESSNASGIKRQMDKQAFTTTPLTANFNETNSTTGSKTAKTKAVLKSITENDDSIRTENTGRAICSGGKRCECGINQTDESSKSSGMNRQMEKHAVAKIPLTANINENSSTTGSKTSKIKVVSNSWIENDNINQIDEFSKSSGMNRQMEETPFTKAPLTTNFNENSSTTGSKTSKIKVVPNSWIENDDINQIDESSKTSGMNRQMEDTPFTKAPLTTNFNEKNNSTTGSKPSKTKAVPNSWSEEDVRLRKEDVRLAGFPMNERCACDINRCPSRNLNCDCCRILRELKEKNPVFDRYRTKHNNCCASNRSHMENKLEAHSPDRSPDRSLPVNRAYTYSCQNNDDCQCIYKGPSSRENSPYSFKPNVYAFIDTNRNNMILESTLESSARNDYSTYPAKKDERRAEGNPAWLAFRKLQECFSDFDMEGECFKKLENYAEFRSDIFRPTCLCDQIQKSKSDYKKGNSRATSPDEKENESPESKNKRNNDRKRTK